MGAPADARRIERAAKLLDQAAEVLTPILVREADLAPWQRSFDILVLAKASDAAVRHAHCLRAETEQMHERVAEREAS